MSQSVVCERGEREADVARRWWQLPQQTLLPLENGAGCLLLHTGQPGGSAGPDVRDAILSFATPLSGSASASEPVSDPSSAQEVQEMVGDVEFHIRASDWFAHGHQSDPRYNQVLLHVVFFLDSRVPTRRQDGSLVPTCSLLDLPQPSPQITTWPCQSVPLPGGTMIKTLLYAGLARFTAKGQSLFQTLVESRPPADSAFDLYDTCLIPALAEGLGYGRDRAFFRAAGLRLVGLPARIPEPLGHSQTPAPLDERRLRILRVLSASWRQTGLWQTAQRVLLQSELNVKSTYMALRALFSPLSVARADILVCNIVLPFAVAVAQQENKPPLAVRAQQLYLAYPGLVSNRVTRNMSAQLQLPSEPEQACLQQGLHHIYAQNCQAKRCQTCLCGGARF